MDKRTERQKRMAENQKKLEKYADILDRERPVSKTHPQMSVHDRAAQFSPFAALNGYEGAVREAARLTEAKPWLAEDQKSLLDERLNTLLEQLDQRIESEITYFQKDGKKEGGRYVTIQGIVKKVDAYEKVVVMESGERISMDEILELK